MINAWGTQYEFLKLSSIDTLYATKKLFFNFPDAPINSFGFRGPEFEKLDKKYTNIILFVIIILICYHYLIMFQQISFYRLLK